MSTAAIQYKIMPESLEVDLNVLKEEVKKTIENFETGIVNDIEERPIAFGLKALIVTFALSESEEAEKVEAAINDIGDVSSIELLDYRRAIG